ncbi:MAG: aminotransferase class III-fold pyridoxal phosphate-dependent enzyme [Candidatus Dadabacteria bacterium]|nr:aminotransferase class III-fold pyridoxal phosphate-dependent enzyme [Candidatus Dadabacteria bacterium]
MLANIPLAEPYRGRTARLLQHLAASHLAAAAADVSALRDFNGLPETVSAVIAEPISSSTVMVPHPEYWPTRFRAHGQNDVLLIVDEVITGFGRTGRMFACEHEDVTPDILVLGKGLTGGYLPLSATITTQEVYDAFLGDYEEFKTFFHGHSYAGNPLSCAASMGNLQAFENYNTLEELQEKVQFLEDELKEFSGLKHVGNVRNKGFMVGIELVEDKETKEPYAAQAKIGWKVADHAMEDGVLLRPLGNVVVLMPPVGIPMEDLKKLLHVTYNSIKKATEDS